MDSQDHHRIQSEGVASGRRESVFTADTWVTHGAESVDAHEDCKDKDLHHTPDLENVKSAHVRENDRRSAIESSTSTVAPQGRTKPSLPTVKDKIAGIKDKHVFNEQTNYALPRSKIVTVFLAVSAVAMAALLDQTILATALNTVGQDLHAGSQVTWISNAFFLTSTSFQLLYGKVSDIVGRKVCLLFCLAIFFIGSLASSLAQDVVQLSVFRAISGIGGGGLITLSQVIISDVVSLRERGKYQGILGAFIAISNGIGPIIGGVIAQRSSWRNIFRLQLGLTPASAVLVIFIMPLKRVEGSWKRKAAAVDYLGALLTLASAALIVLGLNWAGGIHPWGSAAVLAPLLIGLAMSTVFVLYQWKGAKNPLMPLDIFKNSMVAGGCFTMFVNGFIFVVQVYNVVQMYQIVYGYSPIKAGVVFLPLVLMQTVSSTVAGICISRLGRYREILLGGWAIWSIGMGLFSIMTVEASLGEQLGFGLLAGLGVGGTLQVSLIALQSAVPRQRMAVLTASRNFIRNLGAALGLAVAQTTIQSTVRTNLQWPEEEIQMALDNPTLLTPDRLILFREAYLQGFRRLFYILASLAALSVVIVFFFMPQLSIDREDDKELKNGRTPEDIAATTSNTSAGTANEKVKDPHVRNV